MYSKGDHQQYVLKVLKYEKNGKMTFLNKHMFIIPSSVSSTFH